MKKNLTIILFLLAISIFPTGKILAATVEMNFTINSVKIPERAGMVLAADRPYTEFFLYSTRVVITDKNGLVANSMKLTNPTQDTSAMGYGSYANISFPYSQTLAPYNVYTEVWAIPQTSNVACKANCLGVAGGSGWYVAYYNIHYRSPSNGDAINYKNCPYSLCTSYRDNIAFDRNNIVGYNNYNNIICGGGSTICNIAGNNSGVSTYYWRSLSLKTIN